MSTKATPKSCSCQHCRRGKGTKSGKESMRLAERAFRRASRLQTLRFGEDGDALLPAPRGGYYD